MKRTIGLTDYYRTISGNWLSSYGTNGLGLAGCLQLLEIYWNLKTLREILEIWNVIGPPGNFLCNMSKIDRIGFQS